MGQNQGNCNMGLTNASGQLIKTQFQSTKEPIFQKYFKEEIFEFIL